MNAEPVLLLVLLVAVVLLEVELVGPPPISCPTVPLRLATVPLDGETSVAACRCSAPSGAPIVR